MTNSQTCPLRSRPVLRSLVGVLGVLLVVASPAQARQYAGSSFLSSEMNGNTEIDAGEGVGMTFCLSNVGGPSPSAPSPRLPVQVGDLVEPAEVRNMLGTSNGSSAALAWNLDEPGGAVDAIEVRVGSAVGLADITTLLLPPGTTSFAADDVPAGTYHVSARQVGPMFPGHASDSVAVTIPGICAAPEPPAFLAVAPQAGGYRFTWHLGALGTATPTSWALHAGSAPGLSDLAVLPLGSREYFTPAPPPGTYYVRVVAANSCGASADSNEVRVIVP